MEKINKTVARKLYNEGKEIFLLPCKCHPESIWLQGYAIQLTSNKIKEIKEAKQYNERVGTVIEKEYDFDNMVNMFEIYNCNNELGKYTHFYINE